MIFQILAVVAQIRRERVRYRCTDCGEETVYPEWHAEERHSTRYWGIAS